MTVRRIAAAAVAAGLSVVLVLALQSERITEDDPRWDCATMGNRICGPGH